MTIFRNLVLAALLASPVAVADVVVIAHPDGVDGLSEGDVRDIYLNRNNAATPIEMAEGIEERRSFHEWITGRSESQLSSFWAQQTFTGEGQPPEEVSSPGAMKAIIASDEKAIGYIDPENVDASVKVILKP